MNKWTCIRHTTRKPYYLHATTYDTCCRWQCYYISSWCRLSTMDSQVSTISFIDLNVCRIFLFFSFVFRRRAIKHLVHLWVCYWHIHVNLYDCWSQCMMCVSFVLLSLSLAPSFLALLCLCWRPEHGINIWHYYRHRQIHDECFVWKA